jgi:O-antigen/teichoic acid export membrane protein
VKKRIANLLGDAAVRRVMKSGTLIAGSKALGQLAGLASVAVLTRQLGPELFGVFALIRTVAAMAEAYSNFNTWQAVIKYGMEAIAAQRTQDVKRVIKLAMWIDVSTAAIATVVIAGLAFAIPGAFGWSTHEAALCALYGLTVLTRAAGTCDGIFRLCDAYRAQAIAGVLQSIAPMVAVIAAALLHSGLDGAVLAMVIGEIAGNAIDMVTSFWIAAKKGYGGWWKVSLVGFRESFPGVTRFMLATNGQLTVKKTQNELDMLVVGTMLGSYSSGLFKLVKQLGRIPAYVFMPFEQVLFAELSKSAAAGDYRGFKRLLRRFTAIVLLGGLATWVVVAIAADPVVHVVAGEKFLGAVPALRIYMLAMVVAIVAVPTQRALIALGRPGTLLIFDLGTLAALFATAIGGAYGWDITGVAAAVLVHKLIQLAWSTWLVARVVKQRRARDPGPPLEPAPT